MGSDPSPATIVRRSPAPGLISPYPWSDPQRSTDPSSVGRFLFLEPDVRLIDSIAVHCSATPGGKPFRAADIDRWHREKGWDSIGYHLVICLDGSIEPGRPLEEAGAHVQGHNANSIGVCLIGGVDSSGKASATFNEPQYAALRLVLHGLRGRWPNASIRGHRDFPNVKKDCPSFDVQSWCRRIGIDPK